mmetsp:Transcript_28313/g.52725  ORF Transcript_28313/g.52725 Transcript_28313/m.52725 type:complete len:351 (+) Transcript_28313:6591-7643(+)
MGAIQARWPWPTCGPVQQFDRMHHGHARRRPDLHHATDIACCNDVRVLGHKRLDLAILELLGNLGLHQVVGARRAAAEVAVARFHHFVPGLFQQVLGVGLDLLAVLQRTGGVIGDGHVLGRACGQVQFHQHFAHIHGNARDPCRVLGQCLVAEHVPVILDRGAAAAGVDHNRIKAIAVHLLGPGFNVQGGGCMALLGFAHVVGQCPATACTFGHDDLAAQTSQQADGGIVDVGVQGLLGTACHEGHAHLLFRFGRKALRIVVAADGGDVFRRHLKHCPQTRIRHHPGKGAANLGPEQGHTKAHRIGQDLRQYPAQHAVGKGAFVIVFDIFPGVIHQMHIMHPRWASGHAG